MDLTKINQYFLLSVSLGSVAINNAIRNNIDALLEKYQIIHLCGRNNLDESLEGREGYKQFEYVKAELKHYFACANVVVSRAGANAICELLALRKPNGYNSSWIRSQPLETRS